MNSSLEFYNLGVAKGNREVDQSSAPPAVITPKELTGDTIYILDGTSLLYKCFYGLGKQKFFSNLALKLTPSSGALEPQPCGAVAAMATSFTRFCKEVKPSHVVVVFDAGRVTFRNDLFPEYKQQRPETPAALGSQFPLAVEVMRELGACCIQKKGVEADDVMASVGSWAQKQGMNVVHISGDKDMWQLVRQRVFISDLKAKVLVSEAHVLHKYGLPAASLVEYFSLVGDSADNIPGVKGVGPKIALALIREFQTLEHLYHTVSILSTARTGGDEDSYTLALKRLTNALEGVKCKPERAVKLLSVHTLEEVVLFRTLIQLKDDICLSTMNIGVTAQLVADSTSSAAVTAATVTATTADVNAPGCLAIQSTFKFQGARGTAGDFLSSLTTCGGMSACLKHLNYLQD